MKLVIEVDLVREDNTAMSASYAKVLVQEVIEKLDGSGIIAASVEQANTRTGYDVVARRRSVRVEQDPTIYGVTE